MAKITDELEQVEGSVQKSRLLTLKHRINTRFDRMRDIPYSSELPSMTQQQYANETDLNNLVDKNMRFKDPAFLTKLQFFGSGEKQEPLYGDFATVPEFQHAMNVINDATEQFASLPSKIRARFDNDPVKLLAFVNDENNYQEGLELGIYKPRAATSSVDDVVAGGTPSLPDTSTSSPDVQPEGQV